MTQTDTLNTTAGPAIRVLVVEDHQPTREELVRLIVENDDFTVVAHVGTGEEAVESVRRLRPGVVLMDIQLPGINGLEATRIVTSEFPDTRVIAVSNHSDPGLVRAHLEAGGAGYVCKSSAFEELIPAIHAVLASRQYLGSGVSPLD